MTEVTYYGQVHGTLTTLARMHPRNRDGIINVGLSMAYRSIPLQSAYCGAKSVKSFTSSVITELASTRVMRCTCSFPA
ncbi:MAG TPA: hypothetical protein VG317_20860 [Pseudonocardiaceae bacterium]|jgi:short-subunit dehydrogenase|nr:hypothetical protein [Pseudonocardiaceae bacterium]